MTENALVIVPFTLTNGFGDPIWGEIRLLKEEIKRPVIIICHSFMAFKDWGFFPISAELFALAGY